MTENARTFACGTLEATSDTWILNAGSHIILLDLAPFDLSLEHKTISVIGKMGIPASAPGIRKLLVDKLASHADIATRAYEVHQSGVGGSQDDHWFQAERELLAL
jgi:hypothetical protein